MVLARLCLNKAIAGRLARPVYAATPAAASSCAGLNLHSIFSSAAADSEPPGGRRDGPVRRPSPRRPLGVARPPRVHPVLPRRRARECAVEVAETLIRPLERLAPSRVLSGKVREDEARYQLQFEVPGLGKDDIRVAVEDGVLVIEGKKREHDKDDGGGGEWWSASGYHASLVLPEDARAVGITAEVKDGVLYVTEVKVQ